MMRTRYDNAATVSDEHGKGVEVLRQQIAQENGNADDIPIMIAEVDCVIRHITLVSTGALTNGTVNVARRAPGATPVSLTGDASAVVAEVTKLDIPLTSANTALKKGDILELTADALTSGVDYAVIVGWMPDLFSLDADARTYALPT